MTTFHHPTVALINDSTVLLDASVKQMGVVLAKQVARDFAPVWGRGCQIVVVEKGATPPKGAWWLSFLDDSDTAGALGYHDLTPEGLPLGKVFAATDLKYKQAVSGTASHELLEMLGDPYLNTAATLDDGQGGMQVVAYENCDACEGDPLGYLIDGVAVSDFVYPAFFNPAAGPRERMDHMRHLSRPFEIAPGGYLGVWTPASGWTQKHADGVPPAPGDRARVGSRRERRRTPRQQWLLSTVHR